MAVGTRVPGCRIYRVRLYYAIHDAAVNSAAPHDTPGQVQVQTLTEHAIACIRVCLPRRQGSLRG